ncbi:MAG: patatin-like phospholipase family protein [Alphaproteobacteria bacterium]|nr:patatin-like phospholipase family protein [Alphaproteobacteria bacterium]
MTEAKKINLALQGGGSHGAVTWGVVDRLLEDERVSIEGISGASAGAVNATALAYGLYVGGRPAAREKLTELWRRMSEAGGFYSPVKAGNSMLREMFGNVPLDYNPGYQFFDFMTRTFSPYQFNPFDINPLRDILLECIDFDELSRCTRTKLYLSATNVRSGKVHVFRTKDACVNAVCASACLPFLFKAVEIDGEAFWDGGYMGNPVLYPFFYEAESSDILIVHVNPLERPDVPKTAPEIMNRINEISFNSSLLRELRAISFVHKLLDDGWLKDERRDQLRSVRVHSVRSDLALVNLSVASKFATDWSFLTDLRDRGRAIAEDWLAENFDAIGVRSSVNLREMFDGDGG